MREPYHIKDITFDSIIVKYLVSVKCALWLGMLMSLPIWPRIPLEVKATAGGQVFKFCFLNSSNKLSWSQLVESTVIRSWPKPKSAEEHNHHRIGSLILLVFFLSNYYFIPLSLPTFLQVPVRQVIFIHEDSSQSFLFAVPSCLLQAPQFSQVSTSRHCDLLWSLVSCTK